MDHALVRVLDALGREDQRQQPAIAGDWASALTNERISGSRDDSLVFDAFVIVDGAADINCIELKDELKQSERSSLLRNQPWRSLGSTWFS